MYRGLGEMYASDPRFVAYYDKFDPDMSAGGVAGRPNGHLASFLREAIAEFCDRQ
jgi:hypothetical protein